MASNSVQLDTLECYCDWCGDAIRTMDAKYTRFAKGSSTLKATFCSMDCERKDAKNYADAVMKAARLREKAAG